MSRTVTDDNGNATEKSFEIYSSTQYGEKNSELNEEQKDFTARAFKNDTTGKVVISHVA